MTQLKFKIGQNVTVDGKKGTIVSFRNKQGDIRPEFKSHPGDLPIIQGLDFIGRVFVAPDTVSFTYGDEVKMSRVSN